MVVGGGYMGTNLAYDMLCELTCLDNVPPTPDLWATKGMYFPEGGTYASMVVIVVVDPAVFAAVVAAAGTAE